VFASTRGKLCLAPTTNACRGWSKHIVHFYNRLFTEQFSWPKLNGLTFDFIDEEAATWLECPFEENEVLEVVKGISRDKA
jgi:hypothetical protein